MRLAVVSANVAAAGVCSLLDNGFARFYTAPRRATPEASVGSAILLAECSFGAPAFGAPSGGQTAANALVDEDATLAGGNVYWCALVQADGVTPVADCSVGVGDLNVTTDDGFDIEIANVAIVAGRRFGVTALVYTQPVGT